MSSGAQTTWNGRRVLVTGASGFVGHHLVPEFAALGAEVHGLGFETQAPALPLAGWHVAELRDSTALEAALATARPVAIVHLAGQSSAARSFEDPEGTFALNALGTWNLLDAVRERGADGTHAGGGQRAMSTGRSPRARASPRTRRSGRSVRTRSRRRRPTRSRATMRGGTALEVIRTRSFGHTGPGQAAHVRRIPRLRSRSRPSRRGAPSRCCASAISR